MPLLLRPNATAPQLRTSTVVSTVVNNFTMGAWVKLGGYTTNDGLVYNGNGGANGWGILGGASGVGFLFGGKVVGGVANCPKYTWVYAAVIRNAGTAYAIVALPNGSLSIGSTSATAPNAPGTTLQVGGPNASGNPTEICEPTVWERALTHSEIIRLGMGVHPLFIGEAFKWHVPLLNPLNRVPIVTSKYTTSPLDFSLTTTSGTPAWTQEIPPPIVKERVGMYLFPSPLVTVAVAPPINTVAPVASGIPEVGQTLSCTQGTWSPTGDTYAYQWQYNDGIWNNIGGATSSTWVVSIAGAVDAGDSIRCQVTASNPGGAVTADSNTLSPVTDLLLDPHRSMIALG